MRRLILLITLIGMCTWCTSALAQESDKPVVILNPGHDDFVIPPFWIQGRANPGEKLGLFVNGYPHMAIEADARGQFVHRIAWAHSGPVWIEVRRGDERRHAIQLRVAEVTPGVGNRVLSHAIPSLAEVNEATLDGIVWSEPSAREHAPVKVLPAASDSPLVSESSTEVQQKVIVEPRNAPPGQALLVSAIAGVTLQFVGTAFMGRMLTDDAGRMHNVPLTVGLAGVGQATLSYLIHAALDEEPSIVGALFGVVLPTTMALTGVATDQTALTAIGLAGQPLGASFGASF